MKAARAILGGLLVLAVLAIVAAWLVPPMLDWNDSRPTIAQTASRLLGQPVAIEGKVTLSLLPRPELTADRVSVADGVLTVAALRLHVALAPLLAGRIEPRELVLQSPLLRLPWPLPAETLPRAWPAGLSVRIEDGAAIVGTFAARDVQAIAGVGETGALSVSGRAVLGGGGWTFAARLTAVGRDGASGVDLRLDGNGALAGTSARFTGQLAGLASLSGEAVVAGGDLSALMPAPPVSFHAQGRVTAADGLLAADDLAIELAGAPARAAVALRLLPIQRLDFSLAIGRLDLAAWLGPLLHPADGTAWGLPVGLDLSAEAAELAGATLRRLRCAFDLSPQTAELREASAILPGEATLRLTGRITRGAAAGFAGEGQLQAPDLPATAGWVARAAGLDPAMAARLPRAGALSGRITATPAEVALDTVTGVLDGGAVAGALTFRPGLPPGPPAGLALTARLARLDLDAWVPGGLPVGLPRWPARGGRPGDAALSLDVQAEAATLRGLALRDVVIRAEADDGRLQVHRLAARLPGVQVQASGTVDHVGALADGRLDLVSDASGGLAQDVAALLGPGAIAPWLRRVGPLDLTVTAQGPPDAIVAHGELAAAGGRVVADPVFDTRDGSVLGSVGVAHPSAAALLARLGWLPAGAARWLGDGKLAARAEGVSLTADRLAASRLDVQAGALQATGALTADWQGPLPRLTGQIRATTLPLPWGAPAGGATEGEGALPFGLLLGWEAALDVSARTVLVGLVPVASDAQARIGVAEGVLGVGGFTGRLRGGALAGSAAIDGASVPPSVQADVRLTGAVIEAGASGAGVTGAALDLLSGTVSAALRASASGYSLPALRATLQGEASLDVADGMLRGFDLSRLREALVQAAAAGEPGPEVAAALAGGRTAFSALHARADVSSGGLALRDAQLSGPDGQVSATGVVGLAGDGIDVRLGLRPAIEGGPEVGLRLTGPASAPVRTPELSGVLRWLSHS